MRFRYASPIFAFTALRQTSHSQKRCTKSLAPLLYVVQRGADEQSTAVLITRSARDFVQHGVSGSVKGIFLSVFYKLN